MDPAGEPDLRVTFLDVGQGDAAVIELPDGSAILIDTGPSGGNMDAGSAVILPFLRARGISMLHGMIITHPDDDHAGGAHSVLEALPVEHIFIGGRWPEGSRTSSLMTYMIETADSVRDVRAGDRIALPGNATLYVLSPPAEIDCEASNEHSVVVLLLYGSTRFLFTGDTDAQAEHRMIARYDNFLRADVLKVAHHGSTTSTSPGFAVKVRPKHAVISAGRNNHFNHPRQEILDRLRLVGATISRTDIEGAIMFTSDGKSVRKVSPR
jgi:DNA internalization-related competence protein ComEC/Rec2